MKGLTFFLAGAFGLAATTLPAKTVPMQHVHPAFWWAGMNRTSLQILLHGEGIGGSRVSLTTDDVRIDSVVCPQNPNYVIIYADTRDAAPQRFDIKLEKGGKTTRVPYELKARERRNAFPAAGSFSSADVLYLFMPDRFANGDPSNDVVKGLRENSSSQAPDARHGGDIAGIAKHLDYLADLGVTAIWPTPLLVNDMPSHSYHGYAITDYYQIDPRYGSNEDYRNLVGTAHDKGIKVVQDMVFNHCGSLNFLFTDRPADDWFNHESRYVQTSYKISAVNDPHAAQADLQSALDGWFVESMPDFNQRNPHVLDYLSQNSIWWIEFAGIDGIRQDTYPYAEPAAMAEWCRRIEAEYPGFNIVGETWLGSNVGVAVWQRGNRLTAPFDPALPTVMDFPLMNLLNSALDEETNDWDKGLARIYDYLSQDAVYADPDRLLTFLDNHDTPRFAQNAAQAARTARYRQALALLLTLRGIPQLYYGDEIGMAADKSQGDGALRQNFPGGFPGDGRNAFTPEGRTAAEQAQFDFARRLLRWRKGNPAIANGNFRHFAVRDGVYVYSRQSGDRTVTVFINGTDAPACVDMERYNEVLPADTAYEVVSGKHITLGPSLQLGVRGIAILDF